MLEFVAILIALALLWQLRRTDFGKAMFVLLGLTAIGLAVIWIVSTYGAGALLAPFMIALTVFGLIGVVKLNLRRGDER
jgi:hypothetical protein